MTLWYLNETRSELINSGWPFIYLRPALEVSLSLSSRENIIDNLLKFTEHWNRIPRPTSTSSSPLLWPLSWAIYRHLSLWHVWRPFELITCTTLSILPPVSAASAAYLLNSITDSPSPVIDHILHLFNSLAKRPRHSFSRSNGKKHKFSLSKFFIAHTTSACCCCRPSIHDRLSIFNKCM